MAVAEGDDASAEALVLCAVSDIAVPALRACVGGHQEIIVSDLPGLEERWRPMLHRRVAEHIAGDPQGALLADPRGVMEGQGRYSRSIRFRSPNEIDADVVAPILREAAERQTAM
jgi:hypothetical protein